MRPRRMRASLPSWFHTGRRLPELQGSHTPVHMHSEYNT